MAQVLGISAAALGRWLKRQNTPKTGDRRAGRPAVISPEVRDRLRACYLEHFRQWGPQVLAEWCRREGLGTFSPMTVAGVLTDLMEPEPKPPAPVRYEVTAPQVMWSEDGTGFGKKGRKQELLLAQDECSRKKVNWKLAAGPACGQDVARYLAEAFLEHGAPLVMKHDGGPCIHKRSVEDVLDRFGVVDLTSPPYYPGYNGKQERLVRDVKSYVRAMRRAGVKGSLKDCLVMTMKDLNEDRPRPVLGGLTANEAHEQRRRELPSREAFRRAVDRTEQKLYAEARTRRERDSAHRRAVEQVLWDYGLLAIDGEHVT